MKMKKVFIWAFVFILLLSFVSALNRGGYTYSNPKVFGSSSEFFSSYSSNFGSSFYDTGFFDRSMCEEGQDFIIRVDSTKCSPTVVRSDLLEEQDIPVFCPVQAIKINPLIDVSSIDSISFSGDYPRMVKTVGFTPAYTALGGNRRLNNFQWDNVGYVTVILRNEPNESRMPDFVDLNLTARISYDLKGGFGLMTHNFYLPVMTDSEFEQEMGDYAFFNHMGYIRADEVGEDSARISIYRDLYQNPMNANSEKKQRLQSFDLKVGESSPRISLPGFECLSKVKFTLGKIDYADTSAKILVNSEYNNVREKENFLDGACTVKDINSRGLYQTTRVSCLTDEGTESFDLRVSPKIVFEIDGERVNASLGDKIGTSKDGEDLFFAYLNKKNDELKALVIAIPAGRQNELSDTDLTVASYLGDNLLESSSTAENMINSISGTGVRILGFLKEGKSRAIVSEKETGEVSGSTIKISSLGINENDPMSGEVRKEYETAMEDYNIVISNYIGEKYPSDEQITLAENAIVEKINLAKELMQYEDVKEFCLDLKVNFASTKLIPAVCSDDLFLSNEGVSVKNILIKGDYKRLVFNGITEPSSEEYGAIVTVKDLKTGTATTYPRVKKKLPIILNESESFTLERVEEDKILISYNLNNLIGSARRNSIISTTSELTVGVPKRFNDQYEFILQDINLEKVAYVKVEPSVNYAVSEAEFNYKIGIEKRLIQLSPEKARSIADDVNNTVQTLNKIINNLDVVTDTMKKACLATGGVLTLKNILFSKNGETIARGEVMGEWKEKCSKRVPGEYRSLESCYLENADEIDSQVKEITNVIVTQEDTFSDLISAHDLMIDKGGIFGESIVNSTALALRFSSVVVEDMNGLIKIHGKTLKSKTKTDEFIDLEEVIEVLKDENKVDYIYDLDDLKSIDRYYKLYVNDQTDSYYNSLFSAIMQIVVNDKEYTEYLASRRINQVSRDEMKLVEAVPQNATTGIYYGYQLKRSDDVGSLGDIKNLEEGSPIQWVRLNDGKYYYALLRPTGVDSKYRIVNVYSSEGVDLGDTGIALMRQSFSIFELANSGSYNYEISGSDYMIRYYEYGSFKGLPAIVPFDKNRGWYARVDNSFTSTTGFDDSARVQSFYLCNVMADGLIGAGDECIVVSLSTSKHADFPGLNSAETQQLIDRAVKSIAAAGQAQNRKGAIKMPNGQSVPVGEPYSSSISKTSCSDFMSPKECQLLFNLCDPVICPESRCDYGGKYPVQNVVQSGVIGSLMLCAPNINEGIKVPVCLTGVNAGLKGLTSVSEAYRDCLVESAETGKTVGICDEIHSIYMCEFLWRQAIPLVKIAAPSVLERVLEGKSVRGGGEYFSIRDAFNNAQESMKYFTESYAVQSHKAFKARSQDQVGTEVCRSFISVVFPTDLGSLGALTESDTPPQFIASFEEIPYSTTTNPPMSHYKVYYHVYAGEDRGVYYSVYLRGTDSSYYQDSAVGRRVDSGYVETGGYATDTVDFLGPVGYTQLCVRINDQVEECGFGKVSTSFAVNYLSDAYAKKQAGQTDITTEEACISGTANLMSLLNLNAQNAVENMIDPNIAARGIIRICATSNPGKGSDVNYGDGNASNDQWLEVGYCGDKEMKCWIDTQSLEKAFNWKYSYDTTLNTSLKEAYDNTVDTYLTQQGFWDEAQFSEFLDKNLTKDLSPVQVIVKINSVFDKLYFNNHKAFLLLKRAQAYGELVFVSWSKDNDERRKVRELEEKQKEIKEEEVILESVFIESYFNEDYVSPVFEFEDGVANFLPRGKNLFYKYSLGKWEVNDKNENFDWISASNEDFSSLGSRINLLFIYSLREKNYLDGLDILLKRTFANDEGGLFSTDLVSKDSSDNDIVNLGSDKIFEIKNAGDFGSIYLILKDSEWKWYYSSITQDSNNWLSLSQTVVEIQEESSAYIGSSTVGGPIYSTVVTGVDISLSQDIINLFLALEGKTLVEGAAVIFGGEVAWRYFGKDEFYNIDLDELKEMECSSLEECQKIIGSLILEYAKSVKLKYNIDDSQIMEDTGYVSFQCLVAAVALQESSLQFCDSVQKENNPLYCEGEERGILRGDEGNSYGAMQVNRPLHSAVEYGLSDEKFLTLEGNALFGANHLATLHNSFIKTYPNGRGYSCSDYSEKYGGWNMSIRAYNGWNTDCSKGDGNYVENVLKQRETLGKLFVDECGNLPSTEVVKSNTYDESEKRVVISSLANRNWPIRETLTFVKGLEGDYSDSEGNKQLVDKLYSTGVITEKEYETILGKRFLSWSEKDMEYVYELLTNKAEKKTSLVLIDIRDEATFLGEGGSNEEPGEVCEPVVVDNKISGLGDAQQRVILAVQDLRGTSRPDTATNCYTATQYIYAKAGTYTEGNCVYSDIDSKKYSVGSYTFSTSAKPGSSYQVNPSKCDSSNLEQEDKLNVLEPGYLISYYSGSGKPGVIVQHNAIFVKWLDKNSNRAMLFDWNGADKTYRYYPAELSDNVHPVYMIWEPKIG